MTDRPFQYDSLKTVLLYMKPHLRFQLSHRCPSLRLTERVVPLHLDSVQLAENVTKIDNVTYSLLVYKEYPEDKEISDEVKWGINKDVDEWGFGEKLDDLTPGDIHFEKVSGGDSEDDDVYYDIDDEEEEEKEEEEEEDYEVGAKNVEMKAENEEMKAEEETESEEESKDWEQVEEEDMEVTEDEEQLEDEKMEAENDEEENEEMEAEYEEKATEVKVTDRKRYIESSKNLDQHEIALNLKSGNRVDFKTKPGPNNEEITDIEKLMEFSVEHLQNKVDHYHGIVESLRLGKYKSRPTFTPRLQLTIKSPEEVVTYWRPYKIKLYEAMKNLNSSLFGNRVIHPCTLKIEGDGFVLRLPAGMKLRVQNLEITHRNTRNLEQLEAILDQTSFPLKSLRLSILTIESDTFEHPAIKSAEKLIVSIFCDDFPVILPILCSLKNRIVRFEGLTLDSERCFQLIETLKESVKEIGTEWHFSIDTFHIQNGEDFLDEVQTHFNAQKKSEKILILPINMYSSFLITYVLEPEAYIYDKWVAIMKIVENSDM